MASKDDDRGTKDKREKQSKQWRSNAVAKFLGAIAASPATSGTLPGDVQLRVDIQVSLLDAITDTFPITRAEVDEEWSPSGAKIDSQGWGSCLAAFAQDFKHTREAYRFYNHRPRYTEETIDLAFLEIVRFLNEK